MDKQISDILKDLYAIDPQLRAHERELITLVSDLLRLKPNTQFDPRFASQLRAELVRTHTRPVSSPYASFFVSRLFYGVVASAITLLIAVPATFIATQKAVLPNRPIVFNPFSNQVKDLTTGTSPRQQISSKGTNAFGKLAFVSTSTSANTNSSNTGVSSTATSSQMGITATAPAPVTNPLVKNQAEEYTYEYKGDPTTLQVDQGKVFKRMKGIASNRQLSDLIQYSKFNLTNLSTFNDLNLKNMILSEDKSLGYTITINFTEGVVSIDPEAGYWGKATSTSPTPDNATLISIANAFLKSHGIDTSIYSTPVVVASTNAATTIVYPLIIDGKVVYGANATPFGLIVTVDNARQTVTQISNLTSQIYDSSLYPLETDFNSVLNIATSTLTDSAKKGTTTKKAFLGTPQEVLIHYWSNNVELYAPALSFPITYNNASSTSSRPSTIIVPLVKDFLAKANHQ